MTYRTISVDGVDYRYVIGKHCLKIDGVGVFEKFNSREHYGKYDTYVHESGTIEPTPEPRMVGMDVGDGKSKITPGIVADVIRNTKDYVAKELFTEK
jgi:hypothetical protein